MRLNTRLLVALIPAVTVIMAGYAVWALAQRTATLTDVTRTETRAYSRAVAEAFEQAYRDVELDDVQEIIEELSRQPSVYGVFLYDTTGVVSARTRGLELALPASATRVRAVVGSGAPVELDRDFGEDRMFSVLSPIRAGPDDGVTAVLEVVQPLTHIEEERARTTQRFLLNTLTLLVALALLNAWLVRRLVHRPLATFTEAIRKVGEGDLGRRVDVRGTGRELETLGLEFNRMADAIAAARDALVTETEERVALEARLQDRERLASMGTLAAGVAHQISAPLNVIGGRTHLLLEGEPTREKLEADLRTIADQADRIERIVRGLLSFVRQREANVRPVEVGPAVEEVTRRLGDDLDDARVRVEVDVPDGLIAQADSDLLQEVLAILLSNSIEALREVGGGDLSIRGREEGDVVVEVADSGPGFPSEERERIFEAFYTTKPGGTGLGLAVARAILERLAGSIEVGEGRGAVLRIRLPASGSVDV
ncbi:MAG: ATP-binding protein [Gemmatimonadota bacterium]|nr:ATP-binding protein [Gemmatimonadota bacterium]